MVNTPPASRQENRDSHPAPPRNKNQFIIYSLIFIMGFISGVAFSVYKGNVAAPVQAPGGSGQGQVQAQNEEMHQAILGLEGEVAKNPQNYQAWTRLGNLYYDTRQAEKAIAAYSKSLELHQGDANILTDLGVMYRQINQPQKAIAQFDRAMQVDPGHLPSRYNKGVVLMYDLDDPQAAIAAWEEMLRIDPEAKAGTGESIRDLIDKVKKEQAAK